MTDAPLARLRALALEAHNRGDHTNYAALQRVEVALVELQCALTTADRQLQTGDADNGALLALVKKSLFGTGEPVRLPRNPPRIHNCR